MDVILDSNIYLEDIRMSGNQFEELFTYLRRTGARLFLPHLVFEEVTKKYAEMLRTSIRKAESSHENMWKLSMSTTRAFHGPNVDREVDSARKKMKQPSRDVLVVEVDDYSSIDIKEVVNRGVQRKRPASEAGEELRDVILWLLALDLAKNTSSGLIFISSDKTFAAEDGRTLHRELMNDINSRSAYLKFYPSIREFVVGEALSHEEIEVNRFFSVVHPDDLEEATIKLILGSYTRVGNILAVDLREFQFERATMYKVEEQSYFIEAVCSGSASVSAEEQSIISYIDTSSDPAEPTNSFGVAFPAISQTPFMAQNQLVTKFPNAPTVFAQNFVLSQPFKFAAPTVRHYLCSFKVGFSARTIGDKLQSVTADGIQFTSFLSDDSPDPIDS